MPGLWERGCSWLRQLRPDQDLGVPCALAPGWRCSMKVPYFQVHLEDGEVLDQTPIVGTWKKVCLQTWTSQQLWFCLLTQHLANGVRWRVLWFSHWYMLNLIASNTLVDRLMLSERSGQERGWICSTWLPDTHHQSHCQLSLQATLQSQRWDQSWFGRFWTTRLASPHLCCRWGRPRSLGLQTLL